MSSAPLSRIKPIENASALHEILPSVGQLSHMREHSETLCRLLNVTLEITYGKAPVRKARGQTYALDRSERRDSSVRERLLEKRIWQRYGFSTRIAHGHSVFTDVCDFIQTYQMPLQHTRNDKGWGKVDLVGVTPGGLPVVIELKQEAAPDTPLRMLVEGVAYACAVRKAWNEGQLRAEWARAVKRHSRSEVFPKLLTAVPVIILAPSVVWKRAIGSPGKHSDGKVQEDAWVPFLQLVQKCDGHGFPIHFLEFDHADAYQSDVSKPLSISAVNFSGSFRAGLADGVR